MTAYAGERPLGPAAGHAGHVDPEDAGARAPARLRDRPAHQSDLAGAAERAARVALSRPPSPRKQRLPHRGLDRDRVGAGSEGVSPHEEGAYAASGGNYRLAPPVRRDRAHPSIEHRLAARSLHGMVASVAASG